VVCEWLGVWASFSPAPYKYLDVPHTTRELRSGSISWCVRHPNICTGLASSGRVAWALVFWPDYLRFTDPTIVFPDTSVDTRVLRSALGDIPLTLGRKNRLFFFDEKKNRDLETKGVYLSPLGGQGVSPEWEGNGNNDGSHQRSRNYSRERRERTQLPKNGIALLLATNRWHVVLCVSQKRNWSNNRLKHCTISSWEIMLFIGKPMILFVCLFDFRRPIQSLD